MFSGRLSRRAYARAIAIRVGLFVIGYLAIYSFIRFGFAYFCSAESCIFLAGLFAMLAPAVLYLLLALSLIGVTIARLRDIGLPAGLAVIIPVLMLGDIALAALLFLPGLTFIPLMARALSALNPIPEFLLVALVCIAWLGIAPGKTEIDGERWGIAGSVALGVVTAISLAAFLSFVGSVGGIVFGVLGSANSPKFFHVMSYFTKLTPALLLIILLVLAIRQQRAQSGEKTRQASPASR